MQTNTGNSVIAQGAVNGTISNQSTREQHIPDGPLESWAVEERAAYLASLGHRVLVLKPGSKEPATRYGVKDATNDAGELAKTIAWVRNKYSGEPNLGLAMGGSHRLAMLSLDKAKPGQAFTAAEIAARDATKAVLRQSERCNPSRQKSGNDGVHFVVRVPSGMSLANVANAGPTPGKSGIDTRGEGGYIVAPGSRIKRHDGTIGTYTATRMGPVLEIGELNSTELDALETIDARIVKRPGTTAKPARKNALVPQLEADGSGLQILIDHCVAMQGYAEVAESAAHELARLPVQMMAYSSDGLDGAHETAKWGGAAYNAAWVDQQFADAVKFRAGGGGPITCTNFCSELGIERKTACAGCPLVSRPNASPVNLEAALRRASKSAGNFVAIAVGAAAGTTAASAPNITGVGSTVNAPTTPTTPSIAASREVNLKAMGPDTFEQSPWLDCVKNARGQEIPRKTDTNVRHFINTAGLELWFNEFTGDAHIVGLDGFDVLTDAAMRALHLTADRCGLSMSKDKFIDCVLLIARERKWHPIKGWLASLQWDGVPRLGTWLIRYGGAIDTPYVRAVGRLSLLASVARIERPGTKFDQILVLEGDEGTNKSSAIGVLGAEHFTDQPSLGDDGKTTLELTHGKWIIEISELDKMTKREVEQVKAHLSKTSDRGRLAYDRSVTEVPRQFVMFGTTNKGQGDGYLKSDTGNRRFWPVPIQEFDLDALRQDRDQLFAEAMVEMQRGASLVLDKRLWAAAAAEQESRRVVDPTEQIIVDFVDGKTGIIAKEAIWRELEHKGIGRAQWVERLIVKTTRAYGWREARLIDPNSKQRVRALQNGDGPWHR